MFSLNIKPQYIPARYFSFCVLLTVLLVTLSIRSLQGELFITDAQYMVAAGRWIIANGHLPTTDPLSIHSELTYICQQYPICILVAVLYDTFGEMSVRLFFALLDMVAVLFIWYQTFPKAGNRILHCAVSCVFGAVIVYSLRSTPRALDILCLAVSWELMEKYIESRDIRFLFGFPFLGIFIANLHGALWPCAIMLPLAALLDSKLDSNARAALAVTILLTIASAMLNPYGLDVLSLGELFVALQSIIQIRFRSRAGGYDFVCMLGNIHGKKIKVETGPVIERIDNLFTDKLFTGAKTFTLFLGDLRLLPFFLFLQGGDLAIDVFDALWHGTFLSFGYYSSLSSF